VLGALSCRLEQVVEDQVEPSVEDEPLTGEPHDLPDPGTVPIRVAVDLTLPTRGLGVLGAVGPPGHGVAQEIGAFIT